MTFSLDIYKIFAENYCSYGYRRIYGLLKRENIFVSEKVIRRIMREEKLFVYVPKQKKYSSYKGEISPEVPNLLQRNFHAEELNQKWLTDITEFHIPAGKVYLSSLIDCFDGGATSWSIGTSPDADLVNCMLDNAISTLKDDKRPIVHSDSNRQISRYIDTREIMKVAEHNGKFCNIPKHGRKLK